MPTGTSGIVDKNDVQLGVNGKPLSDEEQKIVDELRRVDERVRAHEQAHQAVAGSLARAKSFTYVTGPDGNRYATGGEVKIDTSAVQGDPEATARKMQKVQRAALAPADPSAQDLAVAAAARATESAARIEAARLRAENSQANRRTSESFAPVRPALPQEKKTIVGFPTKQSTQPEPVIESVQTDTANAIRFSTQQTTEQEESPSVAQPVAQELERISSIEEQRRQQELVRAADSRIINTRIAFLNDFYTSSQRAFTGSRTLLNVAV